MEGRVSHTPIQEEGVWLLWGHRGSSWVGGRQRERGNTDRSLSLVSQEGAGGTESGLGFFLQAAGRAVPSSPHSRGTGAPVCEPRSRRVWALGRGFVSERPPTGKLLSRTRLTWGGRSRQDRQDPQMSEPRKRRVHPAFSSGRTSFAFA